MVRSRLLLLALTLCCVTTLTAQAPAALVRERAEYLTWLRTAPTSPFAAIALQRIGNGITLGPEGSDVVLSGLTAVRVTESADRISLDSNGVIRPLTRERVAPLGRYRLLATGLRGRTTLLVFGPVRDLRDPSYFPYSTTAVDTVTLAPSQQKGTVLLLSAEGNDVDAVEAGSVVVTRFGEPVTLRVRRMPGASADESELEINFRDGTSGDRSYPAGRFVSLSPLGGGKFLLDFNRARNPFCAYSSVFPCPAPWPGNTIAARVEAGETYGKAGK